MGLSLKPQMLRLKGVSPHSGAQDAAGTPLDLTFVRGLLRRCFVKRVGNGLFDRQSASF